MGTSTLRLAQSASRGILKRVTFTVAVLDSACCPADKDRIWIYDIRQAGLCMMITNSGAKTLTRSGRSHTWWSRASNGKSSGCEVSPNESGAASR